MADIVDAAQEASPVVRRARGVPAAGGGRSRRPRLWQNPAVRQGWRAINQIGRYGRAIAAPAGKG